MIIKIDKSLDRDVKKIRDKSLLVKLALIIENIRNAKKLSDIEHLKNLKGYHNYYRIKSGDYRLGLIFENGELYLLRFMHRKDIYRYFP